MATSDATGTATAKPVDGERTRASLQLPAAALIGILGALSSSIAFSAATARVPGVIISALCLLLLWPILRGASRTRWLAILLASLTGVGSLLIGLSEAFADAPQGSSGAACEIAAGLLRIIAASILFGSESIDRQARQLRTADWSQAFPVDPLPRRRSFDVPRSTSLRRFLGRVVPLLATTVVALTWGAVWLWFITTDDIHRMCIDSHDAAICGALTALIVAALYVLAIAVFALFVFFCVVPVALLWERPARFLILRRFNHADVSQSLTKTIRRELASLGHCWTLADRDVRVSGWTRAVAVLGPFSVFRFRQREIISPGDLSDLTRSMRRKLIRNVNWYLSRTKVFPVACTDDGWHACVARLVAEVDLVVLDASNMSQGVLWELGYINDVGAIPRTIVLVQASNAFDADQTVSMLEGVTKTRVLRYGPGGMERGALAEHARAMLSAVD